MRVVVALGGNALVRRGDTPDAKPQRANVVRAVRSLSPLAGAAGTIVTPGASWPPVSTL